MLMNIPEDYDDEQERLSTDASLLPKPKDSTSATQEGDVSRTSMLTGVQNP